MPKEQASIGPVAVNGATGAWPCCERPARPASQRLPIFAHGPPLPRPTGRVVRGIGSLCVIERAAELSVSSDPKARRYPLLAATALGLVAGKFLYRAQNRHIAKLRCLLRPKRLSFRSAEQRTSTADPTMLAGCGARMALCEL